MSFSDDAITRSIVAHVMANFTETSLTAFADEAEFNVNTATEWVEFQIDSLRHPVRRRTGKVPVNIVLTAHCYVKPNRTNLYRVQEIADAFALLLDQKTLDVVDYDVSGSDPVGAIRFREATITDVTPEVEEQTPGTGQHLLVTINGVAREI